MGPDNIHNVLLIEAKNLLAPIFVLVYNLCFLHRKIAFLWKIANYSPMPKSGKDASIQKIYVQYN